MLSTETIQAVQRVADISEVVSDFVTLKKKGQNLWACCPFHHEKTPSFAVNPDKGFYKCFGCDAAGDAIHFIKSIEGLNFVEAVKYLAKKYGIPIQEIASQDDASQLHSLQESAYIVLELAQDYYKACLQNDPEGQRIGLTYYKDRGFDEALIQQFALGYSPNAWQGFYQYASQQGHTDDILVQAGLVVQKAEKIYDRFRGRAMFPIHDLTGRVVAFGARVLRTGTEEPKYINSPENDVYHKGHLLYGLYQAKQKIRQLDHCFLVEGYTDVIALHRAGVPNVVASLGTSLTETQVQLVRRFTKRVTLLFDGDMAGNKASVRGTDLMLAQGVDLTLVLLPSGEDPDSYARQLGSTAFQAYLQEQAQDFVTFRARTVPKNDPSQTAHAVKETLQRIALIPDAVKRAVYIRQCSQLFDIDESLLISEHNRYLQQQAQRTATYADPRAGMQLKRQPELADLAQSAASTEVHERESIRLLLKYGHTVMADGNPLHVYLLSELADVEFQTPVYKQILALYQEAVARQQVPDERYFIQHPEEEVQKVAIDLTASPHDVSKVWEERYQICIAREEDDLHKTAFKNVLRLKMRLIHQLMDENRRLLKVSGSSEEEDRLLQVYTSLKESETEVARQLGVVVTS